MVLAACFSPIDLRDVGERRHAFICRLGAVVQTVLCASAMPDAGSMMNLASIIIPILGGVSIVGARSIVTLVAPA